MTTLPPDPAQGGEGAGEGPDIRDLLAMIYRHRWSVLLVLVVFAASGTLWTLRQVPVYGCSPALLEITSTGSGIATVQDVFEREYLSSQNFETLVQILQSEGVVKAAYESDPAFKGKLDAGDFAGGINAEPVKGTFLISITFESPYPELNPLAANAVARSFIKVTREQRESRTNRAGVQLQGRRDEFRKQFEEAERKLAEFRTTNQVADLRAEKGNVDSLVADFERRYDEQQLQLVSLEKSVGEVEAARKAGNLAQIGAVLRSVAYQALERELLPAEEEAYKARAEYAADSDKVREADGRVADLRRQKEELVESIVGQIEAEYETLQRAVEKVKSLRDSRRAEQKELSRLVIEQTNLEAERDRVRRDLDEMVRQTSEVQGTVEFDLSPGILHEEARPSKAQIRPRPVRDISLALVLGVLAALGAAFLLEQFNDAVTRPEEITRVSGLPILGMLPRLTKEEADTGVSAILDPKSEMAEAVRIIRTGILFTPSGNAERRCILITSAESGEGKTILSSNLAVAMAQAGQKTLLVDCDLRKPRVHKVFGMSNDRGLTHIFADGEIPPPAQAVGEGATSLDVLPSGPIPPNPAELLGGERITEFFDRAAKEYQRVIVDSPPAGPVSDPALLARQADGVILVVRLGKTSIRAIRRAVDHLQKVGAPMLGVVLNGASMGGGYYYYYYYRRYGYYGYDEGSKGRDRKEPAEG